MLALKIAGAVLALIALFLVMDAWMGPRRAPLRELMRFPGNDEARRRVHAQQQRLPFEQRYRLPAPGAPRLKEGA